jgi:hypothetical protein
MENDHSEKVNYAFLVHRKVRDVFGRIDYLLRSSVHIQRAHPKQEELFRFIEDNYESMASYYSDLFKLNMDKGGSDMVNRYYFIDYEADSNRSAIPAGDYRYKKYLETSHIIIGMLFFKLYKLDFYLDMDSVSEFIYVLFTEYEEEKSGLFRLIASSKNDKRTDYLEKEVLKEIRDAFDEFERLGWIFWDDDDKDKFSYMPSFERLRLKYQSQITNIDELINNLSDEA